MVTGVERVFRCKAGPAEAEKGSRRMMGGIVSSFQR